MFPRITLGLLLAAGAALHAQESPVAFTGAKIIPITGEPVENGLLLVRHGKIIAVGDARAVRLAADVQIVDVTGKVIMPGLVDSHSHVGGVQGADGSNPIQPDARALDSLDARDPRLQKARAGGITAVHVMPGSGHLI
ncbi:MAG TPA: hypothetical protein PLF88_12750, partial [Opitutaceae bacterium]|nr:hypothetical protein [Opitutaceae bacterium]